MKKCIKCDGLGLLKGAIICSDCLGFGKVEGEEMEEVEEVKKNDEEVSPVSSEVSSDIVEEIPHIITADEIKDNELGDIVEDGEVIGIPIE